MGKPIRCGPQQDSRRDQDQSDRDGSFSEFGTRHRNIQLGLERIFLCTVSIVYRGNSGGELR